MLSIIRLKERIDLYKSDVISHEAQGITERGTVQTPTLRLVTARTAITLSSCAKQWCLLLHLFLQPEVEPFAHLYVCITLISLILAAQIAVTESNKASDSQILTTRIIRSVVWLRRIVR